MKYTDNRPKKFHVSFQLLNKPPKFWIGKIFIASNIQPVTIGYNAKWIGNTAGSTALYGGWFAQIQDRLSEET